MDSGRNNSGRGGGPGRGRGGDGRGYYQNQGGRGRGNGRGQSNQGSGRGWNSPPPYRGSHNQPSVNRPPAQMNQPSPQHAWGNRQPAPQQSGPSPVAPNRPPAQMNQPPPQQAWGNRQPAPQQSGPSPVAPNRPLAQMNQPPPQHAWGNRQPAPKQSGPSPVALPVGRAGAWTGRPWGPSAPAQPQPQPQPRLPAAHQRSADDIDIKTLKISEEKPQCNQTQAMSRPDRGGTVSIRTIRLFVNHFPVNFNPESTIMHYDVDVKPCTDNGVVPRKLRKSEMALIKDRLFSENDELRATALLKTVYDAEKNVFSAVPLPTGVFRVDVPEGEEVKRGSYTFTIKLVNELKLSRLRDYVSGNCSSIPRDILQGMDLVMKDNPSRRRIGVGRSFYSHEYLEGDDLYRCGVAAYRGFQQSLKPTSRGLALCLDYSVIAFRKKCPVIDFLMEHVPGFEGAGDVKMLKSEVNSALKGLKVRVNHRRTKQKYTIGGLTENDARQIYFDLNDQEGQDRPTRTSLLDYFRDKWGKDIVHKDVPCLELGNPRKSNVVPMEFCELVEGQRYPKDNLDKNAGVLLKNLSLVKPWVRRRTIDEMVRADDGPCGEVTTNFGIEVDPKMTSVTGRVIGPPELRLGDTNSVSVDANKRQWNLLGKSLVDGRSIDRWALIDFTYGERYNNRLRVDEFVANLIGRFKSLRVTMEEPLVKRAARMQDFSPIQRLENLLKSVVEESDRKGKGKLQLIVCAMTRRDEGYKLLKLISETKIGVITQCCLSPTVNTKKGQDQTFANLCLKINAKLGGSNFELRKSLPHFRADDQVMFIGADVNHPAAHNESCPSIAAVVGTVNWPAANRYAARVSPQAHRCEKILNFGSMCSDLVDTYARVNNVKPNRIVLFRDGVSEGQFEMVLGSELIDLKKSICNSNYDPSITVIVAQKRHQTRLFVANSDDGGSSGNVPPGTVVDTDIVHPRDFDFYLCSHYGGLGTSKPTHYYVLWDENGFTSDKLQQLIYDMCFTFARCTKPVSLVPPVYYADLVAYRGRMFQEAMLGKQSYATSSRYSSAASTSSSSADASFDPSFYNLHSNLKDVMFFV